MAHRPSVWRTILQGIRQGFNVARSTERFVGQDHLGNRYYEVEEDQSKGIRGSRFVKGPTDDQFEIPDVPHEWNAWMRGKRQDAPSQEELDRNYAMAMQQQIRGREIQQKLEQESERGASEGLIHRMKKGDDVEKQFPTYADYEEFPGDERPRDVSR